MPPKKATALGKRKAEPEAKKPAAKKAKKEEPEETAEVSTERFITIKVDDDCSIQDLVNAKGLTFAKGRGFYELTKKETIQDNKEILLQRKSDKKIISGPHVRDVLGIGESTAKKFNLNSEEIPDFRVFVQSTSYNRKLIGDTLFLYENPDWDGKEEEEEEEKVPAKKPTPAKGKAAAAAAAAAEATPAEAASSSSSSSSSVPASATVEAIESAVTDAVAEAGGPSAGGPVEIVFSFDTTGSMYPCLNQVKKNITQVVRRLFGDIPHIRIAIIAHGDYQDAATTYTIKQHDFSSSVDDIVKFVEGVGSTCGYDFEECYELVLRDVQRLSWTADCANKSLVLIGDAPPHPKEKTPEKIDWKEEAQNLNNLGIRVYAVQAMSHHQATPFYSSVANITKGYHLQLDQFQSIVDFIMAICYREHSQDQLANYHAEVKKQGRLNRNLHQLFSKICSAPIEGFAGGAAETAGMETVSTGRFQVLNVDRDCSIKDFVQENDLIFKAGKGFYEFTKPEKIQGGKEIVLMDRASGDMFSGDAARSLIGLGVGETAKLRPVALDKFRVFVQSTSYNRKLMGGTGFLYEVDEDK